MQMRAGAGALPREAAVHPKIDEEGCGTKSAGELTLLPSLHACAVKRATELSAP